MESFNALVDFAGLTLIDDDLMPILGLTSSRVTFALAALGPLACFRCRPCWHLGQRGVKKLGSTMGLI
jgi:hypothetical protein